MPCIELPLLHIDESFEAANVTKFWVMVVSKFYDPHLWTCLQFIFLVHGCLSIVQKLWLEILFNILEVQVWGCKHVSMFHDLSYRCVEDSNYVHGTSFGIPEFDERLNNMWLSPNTRKWYLDSQLPTQELGLEFPIVHAMEDLPYMMDCLLKICGIFPTFKFP
jgi:hypothetical protein